MKELFLATITKPPEAIQGVLALRIFKTVTIIWLMLFYRLFILLLRTGKSLSEALLFAEHGENMLCTKIVPNVKQFLYTTWTPQV